MLSLVDLNNKVNELYEEYKNDEIILNKLGQYINIELPTILSNTKKQYSIRVNRKQLLQEAHDKFVNKFINNNKYFYCSTSEIFFKYNNEHYSITKEDDIIYNILSVLNHHDSNYKLEYFQEQLLPWKFKIKTSTIKHIREISIFISIPESVTIQNVLNLFKPLFDSKTEIKYFLTVIGDTVLKKNININIISSIAKTLLRHLENLGSQYFGHIPLINSFRYKYHDHNYNECRLLILKDKPTDELYEQIQKMVIDIFVIATYYSNRYGSADDYLLLCDDSDLQNRILFLKNNNQNEIVNKFINHKLQYADTSTISMKNMLYLWKCYLEEINIPNIIFITTLKSILKNKIQYDEEKDIFYNYTSIGLPLVSNFIKFWEETIKIDDNEYYIEIDELCILFKQWVKKSQVINDYTLINLIKHFYPDTIIEEKYIYGITSSIWNKKEEIINFIKYIANISDNSCISLYELYEQYSKIYTKKYKSTIIISKNYFDLFIKNYFKDYINEDMICLNNIIFNTI